MLLNLPCEAVRKTLKTKDIVVPMNTSKINIDDLLVWLVQLATLKAIWFIKVLIIVKVKTSWILQILPIQMEPKVHQQKWNWSLKIHYKYNNWKVLFHRYLAHDWWKHCTLQCSMVLLPISHNTLNLSISLVLKQQRQIWLPIS